MTECIPGLSLHVGDCIEGLRSMEACSVHTCVTSPPYFGLRDYGVDGQIGLEPTPADFLDRMVEVFREVRRVLRNDGTLWLNLGDTYATNGGPGWQGKNGQRSDRRFTGTRNAVAMREQARTDFDGYKPKDLLGMPWRVAFALQNDGWYLRQDIIWHKPNPMPESVRDRCTKAHEYVFLLSKSDRYHFDQDAIKEPASKNTNPRLSKAKIAEISSARAAGAKTTEAGRDRVVGKVHEGDGRVKSNASFEAAMAVPTDTRNKRSVWSVGTQPYPGAHFATFPPDLITPCVLAGAPEGGIVLDPFMGSGTTAGVALALGRQAAGCELNPEYAGLIPDRVHDIAVRFGQKPPKEPAHFDHQGDLFEEKLA